MQRTPGVKIQSRLQNSVTVGASLKSNETGSKVPHYNRTSFERLTGIRYLSQRMKPGILNLREERLTDQRNHCH